jgi:TP901 family phage tail tape measure protein
VAAKEATAAASGTFGKGTGAMLLAGKAAKWGALSIAAMAAEAYKLNVNFGSQMTRVQTMAGASADEVARLRGEVLDLAGPTGQSPQELAAALYHVESIGLRGAKAMDAVHAAADGAAMGGANLEDTATALGAAMRVHIKGGADDARAAMGQLAAIAGAGNMTMEDLVHALGTGILPAAKAAGLSLLNVGSAIALLTDEGYPASSAAAQLGTALHFLYAPTNKARDALADLGLSQADLVNQMNGPKGLMGALQLLEDRLQGYSGGDRAKYLEKLGDILPGGRGRVLILLMNQLDNYQRKLDQTAGTASKFGEHLQKTHETAKWRLQSAWNSIIKDMIRFADVYQGPGTTALVAVMNAIGALIQVLALIPAFINGTIDAWNNLPGPLKIVVEFLGLLLTEWAAVRLAAIGWPIIAGIAAGAFELLAGAAETAAIAMLLLLDNPILLGIAVLIAAIVLLVTHWKWAKHVAVDAWHWTEQAAVNALHWITRAARNTWNWIKHHWFTVAMLGGPFGIAAGFIITHFNQIKRAVGGTIRWVKRQLHNLIQFADSIPGKVVHGVKSLPGKVLDAITPHIPGFAQGTMSAPGGFSMVGERGPELINLPRGASVIPTGQSYFEPRRHTPNPAPAESPGGEMIELHSHLYLDGKEVTTVVNKHNADRKARR